MSKRMKNMTLRRIGFFVLSPVLLLCALCMAPSAYAADEQYMLELATGASTGSEQYIKFMVITYSPADGAVGELCSTIAFINEDSLKASYRTAGAAKQRKRDNYIYNRYGYRADDSALSGRTPFQSYQVDQYLFTAPSRIGRIDNIKIFAGSRGTWTSQGVRVFRVDRLGEVYRWNDLANETYIDFEGELLAEGCKGGKSISWTSDKLISLTAAHSAQRNAADLELQTEFDDAYRTHQMQHDTGKTMAIRFDFADVYGGGLECLSLDPGKNTLGNLRPVENMLLGVRYVDRYGSTREASTPAVINSIEYARALGADADTQLAGLAQQGESLLAGVFLPDFGSFSQTAVINLTLGGKTVREACRLTADEIGKETASMSDSAALLTVAVYLFDGAEDEPAEISAEADAAAGAIRYEFKTRPYAFFSAGSALGEVENVGSHGVALRPFNKGDILVREESKTDRFLIELTTDDVPEAGTTADIMMSIAYTDLEGKKQQSGTIRVRERANDYYGYWPGSRDEFGYYYSATQGKTLRFIVTLPKAKEITAVKTWIEGTTDDEWQMSDFTISVIREGPLKRNVTWGPVSAGGLRSDRLFDRYVSAEKVYEYKDTADSPILLQPGQEVEDIGPRPESSNTGAGSGGVDVTTRQEHDWSQLRYNMTYEDASQDLGFTDTASKYKVAVHVGNTIVSESGNGDSGSRNLFHFRLIFEGGSSGFVLANQQLSGDGFRAGQIEIFTIPTNRDYGDVTAVQIVPDDVSGESDKFDKLEINSIEVTKIVNSSLSPTWTVSKVGWIGIDYRDEGTKDSIRGQKGRSAEDLTQTYLVDGSTYSIRLMVAIQTDSYDSPDEQFRGALSADVYYEHHSAYMESGSTGDIVEAMYDYQRRAKQSSAEVGGMAISDPNWMFRANHTDRFIFEIRDVKQINRMVFHARGTDSVNWNISGVALYLVNGSGKLRLNANREYEQFYEAGEELTPLAYSTSELMPYAYSQHIEKYNNNPAAPNAADITVNFTKNEIELSPDAKQWTSVISREPTSRNDTLNLFLWPEASTGASAYGAVAKIVYSDMDGHPQQTSTGVMNLALYNGEPVFYATNVRANALSCINSITVSSGNGAGINGIRRGFVQRVRSGVVVKSWEVGGSGLSDFGIILGELPTTTVEEQRVLLQLGADTENTALRPETEEGSTTELPSDLAVALWYRSDNPDSTELRTPYVYLTDLGYTKIHPGQVVELKFHHLHVAEITGISVVSIGSVKTSVDAAYATNRMLGAEDGALVLDKGEYSFAQPLIVTNMPNRMNPEGAISPVTVTFLTDKSQENVSGGTSGPVRMTLGYYDRYGSLYTPTYDDLRMYIQDGESAFRADAETSVKLLVNGIDELRYIELEPYREQSGDAAHGTSAATWNLKEVKLRIGETGSETDRGVGQTIIEGKPLRLSMADILLSADVYVGESAEAQTMTGGSLDLQLKSGESVRVLTSLIGSTEGLAVKLESYDPVTGAIGNADLADTRGYTRESLEEKARQAVNAEEAAIWRAVEPQPGALSASDPAKVTFLPPRNYTDGDLGYRLTICSRESSAAAVVLNISVKNEPDPTKKTIEDFMQEMLRLQQENAEKIKELQAQVDGAKGDSESSGAGKTGENP